MGGQIMKTIVKIAAKDQDAIEEVCAIADVPYTFYTMENNPLMLQVEFDASPSILFHLGRMIEIRITQLKKY
jgi:hypothetical protein